MKSSLEVLKSYAQAFRDLIHEKVGSSSKTPRESLHLNKDEDWDFVCVAMDIVGDASEAIRNFLQFGLNGPTKYEDWGERYLRLYGVLNATYIQQKAVLKLYQLMQVHGPTKIQERLNRLEIRTLRHMLASHGTDYDNKEAKAVETYVPVRLGLDGFKCMYSQNRGKDRGTFPLRVVDLEKAIEDHHRVLISVMDIVYEKTMQTLYHDQREKLTACQERLKDLRLEKDGAIVARYEGMTLVIHTRANRNPTPRSARRAKKPRIS
jgi:hypothetical protein